MSIDASWIDSHCKITTIGLAFDDHVTMHGHTYPTTH